MCTWRGSCLTVDSLLVVATAVVCGTVLYIVDTMEAHHQSSIVPEPGYRPSGGCGHRREELLIVDDVEVEREEGEGGGESLTVLRMGRR